MKDELLEILQSLHSGVDYEAETALIDDKILDSFDLVTLIGAINDTFDVEVSFDDIEPQNFNSMEGMMELIRRLQEEE